MKLNPRELEVLKILHENERALTSTEIVNSGEELTQSTVQAVLRKLLAAELVEVQGVTHSGNVLSRTFGAYIQVQRSIDREVFGGYQKFSFHYRQDGHTCGDDGTGRGWSQERGRTGQDDQVPDRFEKESQVVCAITIHSNGKGPDTLKVSGPFCGFGTVTSCCP